MTRKPQARTSMLYHDTLTHRTADDTHERTSQSHNRHDRARTLRSQQAPWPGSERRRLYRQAQQMGQPVHHREGRYAGAGRRQVPRQDAPLGKPNGATRCTGGRRTARTSAAPCAAGRTGHWPSRPGTVASSRATSGSATVLQRLNAATPPRQTTCDAEYEPDDPAEAGGWP